MTRPATESTAGPLTVLHVGVVGGRDRVDLVVPTGLSVAELVVEAAARLGVTDLASGGPPRLAVVGGPPLAPELGLADQGVTDGALLALTSSEPTAAPVYDDLAVAVAEVVEALPRPDDRRPVAATVLATAALLAGAAGAVVDHTRTASFVGSAAALLLLGLAALAARRHREVPAAVAGWCAVAHAAGAGAWAGASAAAAAVVGVGLAAALLARSSRTPTRTLWAAPVAGGVLLAIALGALATPLPLPVVAIPVLAGVVLAGDLVPWAAAWVAGLVSPALDGPADRPATAIPPAEELAGAVRRAHGVLQVWAVAVGLLLAVLGPVVAGHGRWGPAVAVLCCAVVALRGRRHRAGRAGAVALAGALAALLPVGMATWAAWPAERPLVSAVAVGAGLLALAAVVLPTPSALRAGRLAELLEALVLVALPPAVLVASGLLDVVRELVP